MNIKKEILGGQAVIEGVMMRNGHKIAIATRDKDGVIKVKTEELKSTWKKFKPFTLPFLRGIFGLVEMMVVGFKALSYSADQQIEEEEEGLSRWNLVVTFGVAILLSIALFIALPLWLTKLLTAKGGIIFNIIDGVIRIAVFLIYIGLISFMKDIRTLFMYHGAEHKAVHCYEKDPELTVENAKKHSTLHPRCGTSFILFVLVISILVFSLVTSDIWFVKFLSRIILIPIIAGISFEVLKLSARFSTNKFVYAFISPGLALQKVTTREPEDHQLEVALEALKHVL